MRFDKKSSIIFMIGYFGAIFMISPILTLGGFLLFGNFGLIFAIIFGYVMGGEK